MKTPGPRKPSFANAIKLKPKQYAPFNNTIEPSFHPSSEFYKVYKAEASKLSNLPKIKTLQNSSTDIYFEKARFRLFSIKYYRTLLNYSLN